MRMQHGEVQKVTFSMFKKLFQFENGKYGLVLERDGKAITLYGTDSDHKKVYCAIPLGPESELKKMNFYVFAPDANRMLLGVRSALIVIDFRHKRCCANVNLQVYGSEEWGANCIEPWKEEYKKLFGIPEGK